MPFSLGPIAYSFASLLTQAAPAGPAAAPTERPAPPAFAAICAAIRAEQSCPVERVGGPDAPGCACTIATELSMMAETIRDAGPIHDAVAVRLTGSSDDSPGMLDSTHLALLVGPKPGTWVDFGEIASSFEPGAFGIHNEGKVERITFAIAKKPVAAGVVGTGHLLVVTTENDHSDSDLGNNALQSDELHSTIICGEIGKPDAPRVACIELATDVTHTLSKITDNDGTPPEADYGKVGTTRWTRTVTATGDGRIKVTAATGKAPADDKKLSGTFTLEALIARAPSHVRDPLAH